MFRKLFNSSHRRPAPRLLRKPMLEALEDRLTPSGYSLTDLSPLQNSSPYGGEAINNSGQVVGSSAVSGASRNALLYSSGQVTNLGSLSSDNYSSASGINNSGQIVGSSLTPNGSTAFLFSNGQMTDLNSLVTSGTPGQLSAAVAINDSGQIAGSGFPKGENGPAQAFLYSNGNVTYLSSVNDFRESQPTDINASGQVVGYFEYSDGGSPIYHAFAYTNGQMTDLGTLGGTTSGSDAYGINASGQIVGISQTSSSIQHAFLYSDGSMTDLGLPSGFKYGGANDINTAGQIVGYAGVGSTVDAFLYSNGTWTDLNSLLPAGTTVTLTEAFSINDNGQIVANGSDGHFYLLTPQQSTGTVISNGTVSPNTLTASNSGQQVTVSATVNTDGSPATTGNVVFSLVDSNGAVVSDGPTGVAIGSNGQASDTLTVPAGTAAGSYSLSVAYTNNGQTTTQAFTGALTISTTSSAPAITVNPSNQSVAVGQTATFTATASGSPTPTVQWQLSSDGGATWTNINLPSSTVITLPNVSLAQNGLEVRAIFTNSAGSVTTSVATLAVTASPTSPLPPTPPAPTPAPSSPSIPDQIQQMVQDVALMGQALLNGDLGALGQALQDYESLLVTVELEIVQIVLNDLAQLLNS